MNRNPNQIKKLVPFFLLSLLIACTARIDVQTEDAPERLVIYGYITNATKQHEIRLTRSNGYFATTQPEGISHATVTLVTDNGSLELEESSTEAGLYLTPADFTGKEGATYTLQVSLDFDNDGEEETFEATSTMPYAAQVDSIDFKESTIFSGFIEILLYGKVPHNEINFFSFHAAINGVIVNDSLSGIFIISDEYFDKDEFAGIPCFYLDQDEEESYLAEGDDVTLRVDVLTEEYAIFLDNAASEVGGSIPIFSGPPANVETNIQSVRNPNLVPVSGFFSAYAGDEVTQKFW